MLRGLVQLRLGDPGAAADSFFGALLDRDQLVPYDAVRADAGYAVALTLTEDAAATWHVAEIEAASELGIEMPSEGEELVQYLISEFIYMCQIISHLILSLKQLSIQAPHLFLNHFFTNME